MFKLNIANGATIDDIDYDVIKEAKDIRASLLSSDGIAKSGSKAVKVQAIVILSSGFLAAWVEASHFCLTQLKLEDDVVKMAYSFGGTVVSNYSAPTNELVDAYNKSVIFGDIVGWINV